MSDSKNCDEYAPLLTGYIDQELGPEDRARLDEHLADCEGCRAELDAMTGLKEELAMLDFQEPTDVELEAYWDGVYNRLERGIGWVLISIGAIALLSYGGFRLVEEIVRDPNVATVLKVGVVAAILGLAILFVSILRERLAVSKADRYSREIKR